MYHLALGELLALHGDDAAAAAVFATALRLQRVYPPAVAAPGALRVLAPMLPAPWPHNVPLDFVLDRARTAVTRWYLTAEAPADAPALPPYDALPQAVNDPRRLPGTARPALAATLDGVPGCNVPRTVRVAADELAAGLPLPPPVLVRPVDAHGGRGLARVASAAELRGYLAQSHAAAFDVTAFVDFRAADGRYRKYRVMFVDGRPYPYHAAVADGWLVHAHRTEAARDAALRSEDERFLAAPASVFPRWDALMPAIAAALGLDYAGIDCARLPNGDVLVFEADAAMLVYRDARPAFAYRAPAVAAIGAALERLLYSRRLQPFRP